MKKHLLIGAILISGLAVAQTGKVGVETDKPTETLHVKGTVRITDLPSDDTKNAINTDDNGTDTGGKNQTFNATRTVVANDQGVLGSIDALPAGTSGENEGTKYYIPVKKCAKTTVVNPSNQAPAVLDFPETGNAPSKGIKSSHGNAFVFSNNSSKVTAVNSPTMIFILSAVRSHKFVRAMSSTFPLNRILPFSTSVS